MNFKICRAEFSDREALVGLMLKLWPDADHAKLLNETAGQMVDGKNAFFLAACGENPAGFCHVSLRYDYVESCATSPVGFLEGIFVEEDFRRHGAAKALVAAAEKWAAGCGCTEFASDRELENELSEKFHLGVGFREANRIVCYLKPLETAGKPEVEDGF